MVEVVSRQVDDAVDEVVEAMDGALKDNLLVSREGGGRERGGGREEGGREEGGGRGRGEREGGGRGIGGGGRKYKILAGYFFP
jgi:hypothetical protein